MYRIVIVFLSTIVISCSPKYARDFDLVNSRYKLKPDSIVVLPGALNDQNLLLATQIRHIYAFRERASSHSCLRK